jgi:heavy metal translocating P-type ATPase
MMPLVLLGIAAAAIAPLFKKPRGAPPDEQAQPDGQTAPDGQASPDGQAAPDEQASPRGQASPPARRSDWEIILHLEWEDVVSLFRSERKAQAAELAGAAPVVISRENQELDGHLEKLGAATALALVGSIFSPLRAVSALLTASTAWPLILKPAYRELKDEHKIGLLALDTVGIVGLLGMGMVFPAALAGCLHIFTLKLVLWTKDSSQASLVSIFGRQSRSAWKILDDVELEIPVEDLRAGDIVVVHAGEMIPADGVIAGGAAGIDQRALTGESQPVERSAGDEVFASTVVLSGKIQVRVERSGSDTTAAKIAQILNRTSEIKLAVETRGEAMADQTAAPMLGVGTVALLAGMPVTQVLALLNTNFGFNIRILAPIAMLNYLNLASREGILVKDGRALELLQEVDTVVFDKTGTLTEEMPHVGAIHTCAGHSELELLRYAATAEHRQTHPIARAILKAAQGRGLAAFPVEDAAYQVGHGIRVAIADHTVLVGSPRFMKLQDIPVPPHIQEAAALCDGQGHTLVMVAIDGGLAGALEMRSTLRPEARAIVRELRARHVQAIHIISGDNEGPTRRLAEELGVDCYFANTLPEEKAAIIERLQREGRRVCYVGDGINDAIALKRAHVSVSLRGASTIATDVATVVLVDESLSRLCRLFDIADEFKQTLDQSLASTIIPGVVSMAGVLFLNWGVLTTIAISQLGFALGFASSVMPLLRSMQQQKAAIGGGQVAGAPLQRLLVAHEDDGESDGEGEASPSCLQGAG